MKQLWGHPNTLVRFLTLYGLGLALFSLSWILGYGVLPRGVLRGLGVLGLLAGDSAAPSFVLEFARIAGLNLIGFGFIVGGNLLLRVRGFSFGYLVPLAWMILYGLTLGTNSFGIAMEQTPAPGLWVLGRSGLYEMMAACLLAVGTDKLSRNQSPTMRTPSVPVPADRRPALNSGDRIAIGLSLILLAGAAAREAWMILQL